MAMGAWSAASLTCQTLVNANPFRPEGFTAKPKHFDPYQLEMYRQQVEVTPVPRLKMRIGQLKGLFVKE